MEMTACLLACDICTLLHGNVVLHDFVLKNNSSNDYRGKTLGFWP